MDEVLLFCSSFQKQGQPPPPSPHPNDVFLIPLYVDVFSTSNAFFFLPVYEMDPRNTVSTFISTVDYTNKTEMPFFLINHKE